MCDRAFSALSNLQQLHIGIVKHVTGDAFAEGLVRHPHLWLVSHCCHVSPAFRLLREAWHALPV